MNDWIYKKQFDTMNESADYWHSKSCHLNHSSKILWNAWEDGDLIDNGDTYLMLMGLALELLLKAFYIANGKNPPKHHDLDNLTGECSHAFTNKDNIILKNLSGYIVWLGRYPTPLDKVDRNTQKILLSYQSKSSRNLFTIHLVFQISFQGNQIAS